MTQSETPTYPKCRCGDAGPLYLGWSGRQKLIDQPFACADCFKKAGRPRGPELPWREPEAEGK